MYYYQVLYKGKKLLGSLAHGHVVIEKSDPIRTQDDIAMLAKEIRKKKHLLKCQVIEYLKLTNEQYKSYV